MITVTSFKWVPDFARGHVRDLRVRWALEEAGLAYRERLIGAEDQSSDWYRREQPFGQVPVYQENGLTLFESGAIVLHIAEKSEALMPRDPAGRARVAQWVVAALNSIEPHVMNLGDIDIFEPDRDLAKLRRPRAVDAVKRRLDALAAWLGGREWLDDRFSAGDLMMSAALRIVAYTDLLKEAGLDAYHKRCEARPAFGKALKDQLESFADDPSAAKQGRMIAA